MSKYKVGDKVTNVKGKYHIHGLIEGLLATIEDVKFDLFAKGFYTYIVRDKYGRTCSYDHNELEIRK